MTDEKANSAASARRPRRRWWVRLLLADAALLAAAAGVWQLSIRRPAGSAEGVGLRGGAAPRAAGTTLRVAMFNIHGGKGLDGTRDLERIAGMLEGFDLIGLSEAYGPPLGSSRDQAERLGRRLGMSWLFAPAERRWGRDYFGNAILSLLPVGPWRRTPLPGAKSTYRNMLQATARWGGRDLAVLVVHVDADTDRPRQLQVVTETFLSLPPPAVLLGDLNARPDDPVLAPLLGAPGVVHASAAADWTGVGKRLDYILLRGLRLVRAGVDDRGASDHPRLWAELAWPQGPEDPEKPEIRSSKSETAATPVAP